ncbi:hypothetical protein [Herbiconiux sp. YIM B11900]|uniref:hypothetical protein n=1 Tax=Herbiconiux sp. YIM B11900 TaxID=3404131 RepID=UPI003F85FA81
MLFVIVILAALALWGVIVAVLAIAHDGPGRRAAAGPRPDDYPLLTDARFFTR